MKVKLSFLTALLMLMMLMAFSPLSRAACVPAPDPDLNNDGIVNKDDLLIVSRSNGVAKGNPRYNPLADTNCDGKVNPVDIHFVNKALGQTYPVGPALPKTTIGMSILPDEVEILEGKTRKLSLGLSFTSSSKEIPFNIKVSQNITPAINNPLSPSINGLAFTFSQTTFKKFEQQIPILPIGEYLLNTTVSIVETGQSETTVTKISIKPENSPILGVGSPRMGGIEALPVDSVKTLNSSVYVVGKDMENVIGAKIKSLDSKYSIPLTRAAAGAELYKGSLTVDTHGMQIGECIKFIAEVTTTKGIVTSKSPETLCVTSFPTENQPYHDVWSDTVLRGTRFALNSFDAMFNDGVSEQRIKELVATIGGKVVSIHFGTKPRIYVILLEPYPQSMPELLKIMNQFRSNPEVKQVELTIGVPLSSMETNDPVAALQPWLTTIRADEAWYVAQGGTDRAIAVLDTGIDSMHIEFQNRIIVESGKDFVNEGGITSHHGTHVAGVAAANTNNYQGVAGVTWKNPLIDIKIAAGSGGNAIASPDRMVKGIKYAANLQLVYPPIVNFSIGFQET